MNGIKNEITEMLFQSHGIDISKYDDDFIGKSILRRIQHNNCANEKNIYTTL